MEALDTALSFHQQTDNRAPAFHRFYRNESQESVVMPRRSEGRVRDSPPPPGSRDWVPRNVLDDTDVVEVVKVRRKEKLQQEENMVEPRLTKSKSFRARASKAFKSIRNLNGAKSNHRHADAENIAPTSEYGTFPRSSTPNLPRRKSMQLSQFFSSTRGSRSASFDVPPVPPSPTSPMSPTSPTSSTSSDWSQVTRPSLTLSEHTNIQAAQDNASRPTLSSKKSFRHRISVLDLQRLFTSSSQTSAKTTTPQSQDEEIPPSSREFAAKHQTFAPSMTSRSTSGSSLFHTLNSAFSGSSSTIRSPSLAPSSSMSEEVVPPPNEDEDFAMGDESFELRLDSFHFDSLQFDPEEY